MLTDEQRNRAKARILAKEFAQSIPAGINRKIPDDVFDSMSDEQLKWFDERMNQLGFVHIKYKGYERK